MVCRALFFVIPFAILVSLIGCSESNSIQEPWVTVGGAYLDEERSRSAANEDALRERLVTTQIDR